MRKLFIVLAVAAFVVSFTIPAIAEVSFFGQVRMQTYMWSQDEDAGDDSGLNWDIDSGASRFGANFKAGDVSATVSMRPNTGSFFRHWYGKWNFGAASLVVGQTWTPTFQPIDESVIGGGVASFGGSLRKPQLAIHMGDLKLALRKPSTAAVITGSNDQDVSMPAIEASYKIAAGPAGITLFFGYNAYDDVNTTTDDTESISSLALGGNVALSFGAVTVKVTAWTIQNGQGGFGGMDAEYIGGELKNATTIGYEALFGYKISDTMTIYAGYGATNGDLEDADDTDTETNTYVVLPITLAKNVVLYPSIVILDGGVDSAGNDEGTETRYGARWRINF